MSEYNESEIEVQMRAGDTGAFCEWIEKHKNKALSIAYSFCANYEEAKDLSQEAFIKAFKTLKSFRGQSKLYTWFYRILVNLCKDYLRAKKNKTINFTMKFNSGQAVKEEKDIFESIPSQESGPKEQLLNKELSEKLSEAISFLPEKQRMVFTLKNINGLTIAEIAEITQCASGTIKAHLFKATLNLQERLAAYARLGGIK